jgi:hypothetical protein
VHHTIFTYGLGHPVDRRYLPHAIAKHTQFLSALVRNFQEYCDRGLKDEKGHVHRTLVT